MKPDFLDEEYVNMTNSEIEKKVQEEVDRVCKERCDIEFINNLLKSNALALLPLASIEIPKTEVIYNWSDHDAVKYDINTIDYMRSQKDYFDSLERVLIEDFSHTQSGDGIYNYAIGKTKEIAAYGDFMLYKLWAGHIANINDDFSRDFIFADVPPSEWMTTQLVKISIRFVGEDEMKRPPTVIKRGNNDPKHSEIMDALGQYSGGEIKICHDRLQIVVEEKKDMGLSLENLFVIVYLHELAHAMLDSSYHIINDNYKYVREQEPDYCGMDKEDIFDVESLTMEESLANMIMLKYLKVYSEKYTDYEDLFVKAKMFVEKQTSEYSFGLKQLEADVDWGKWRKYKTNNKESDTKLKEWYTMCFELSDIRSDLHYTNDMFRRAFY